MVNAVIWRLLHRALSKVLNSDAFLMAVVKGVAANLVMVRVPRMSELCKIVTNSAGIQNKNLVKPNTKLGLFRIKLYFSKIPSRKRIRAMVCSSPLQLVICKFVVN